MREVRPRDEIDKLYKTNKWRKLRKLVIARDFGVCQECQRRGIITRGVVVHHIIEAREDITKFWDIDNLELTLKWKINPQKGDYVPFIYEPLNINTYIQVVGIKTYPAIPNKPPEITLSNTKKTMTAILANMVKKGVV